MNIIIKPESGDEFTLAIDSAATLQQLQQLIADHLEVDNETFRMIYRGRVLGSSSLDKTLEDLNIVDGSEIEILTNIRPSRPSSEVSHNSSSIGSRGLSGLGNILGSQVMEVAISDENGEVVRASINGEEQNINNIGDLLSHLPSSLTNLFSGAFSNSGHRTEPEEVNRNIENESSQEEMAQQESNEHPPRPETRRTIRRPSPEINGAIDSEPDQDNSVADIQNIVNEIERERQTSAEIINQSIKYAGQEIKEECDTSDNCRTNDDYQELFYRLHRLQSELVRMTSSGNKELAEILQCLMTEDFSREKIREILRCIEQYLQ